MTDDGEVVPDLGGNGFNSGVLVRCSGGGIGSAPAGEGDGKGVLVPVHVLAHDLADGPDGEVGGAVAEDGLDLLPLREGSCIFPPDLLYLSKTPTHSIRRSKP